MFIDLFVKNNSFNYAHVMCTFRSSDSTKYGTNKSSGTSVTSGKHMKNQTTYGGVNDSVSSGKPPLHPNHHHNIHNHRITPSIPVHSSNNRLSNNTVFHNNQYTFSLNRYDDSGYLESCPLSSASLYGDGPRISRGTKSDIGVPIRRPSKGLLNSSNSIIHSNQNKDQLTSVKSDFLLSYLNNNQCKSGSSKNVAHNLSDRSSLNNNGKLNDCINSSAYHISGVSTSDYTEMYKNGAKYLYPNTNTHTILSTTSKTNSNSSGLEHINRMDHPSNHSSHTVNEQQRNQIINFVNRSKGTSNSDAKNSTSSASGACDNRQTSNVVGPLLYIDPTSESSNNTSNNIMTDIQNYSRKNVSRQTKKLTLKRE